MLLQKLLSRLLTIFPVVSCDLGSVTLHVVVVVVVVVAVVVLVTINRLSGGR